MDERVRFGYSCYDCQRITSKLGGRVQIYVKLSDYGIMRDNFISAVGFILVCDILSDQYSLFITQYTSYITLGALVIKVRSYHLRRTATIYPP